MRWRTRGRTIEPASDWWDNWLADQLRDGAIETLIHWHIENWMAMWLADQLRDGAIETQVGSPTILVRDGWLISYAMARLKLAQSSPLISACKAAG